jgi:nitrate reductase gamma subunit
MWVLRVPQHRRWFRSLFACHPNVKAITSAAFLPHAAAAWAILMVWPFSRLVHAWSYPLWYWWWPYIVIRSRVAPGRTSPAPVGAGGAKSASHTGASRVAAPTVP